MAQPQTYSVTRSLALPEWLWPIVDTRAKYRGMTRNGYIRFLLETDMRDMPQYKEVREQL